MFLIRVFDLPLNYISIFKSTKNTYKDLMDEIFSDAYGQANYLGAELNKKGLNSLEIIPNFKKAQFAWVKENSTTSIDNANWKKIILEKQIEYYRPEILLFVGWNYGGV